MKKMKLLTVAVAAALAPVVYAAEGDAFKIYGEIDAAVVVTQGGSAEDGTMKRKSTNVDDTGSRLGFKGKQDLGGGSKAFFLVETGISIDKGNGYSNKTPSSGKEKELSFGSREAWLGLEQGIASLAIGRGKTAYQHTLDLFDPFYSNNTLDLTAFGGSAARFDNDIKAALNVGAFSLEADYGLGEDSNSDGVTVVNRRETYSYAVQAKFETDRFFAVLAANEQNGYIASSTTVTATRNAGNVKNALVGGGVNFGPVGINAAYQMSTKTTAATAAPTFKSRDKSDDVLLGMTLQLNAVKLNAGVINRLNLKEDGVKSSEDATRMVLGAHYALSKLTTSFFELQQDFITGAGNHDVSNVSLGVSHKF